jgi:hypothetical protein
MSLKREHTLMHLVRFYSFAALKVHQHQGRAESYTSFKETHYKPFQTSVSMDLNQVFEGEKVPRGTLVTSLLMPPHTTNFSLLQPLHTAYNPLW